MIGALLLMSWGALMVADILAYDQVINDRMKNLSPYDYVKWKHTTEYKVAKLIPLGALFVLYRGNAN